MKGIMQNLFWNAKLNSATMYDIFYEYVLMDIYDSHKSLLTEYQYYISFCIEGFVSEFP